MALSTDLIAWILILAAATGMFVGFIRPPGRQAARVLAGLALVGAAGFLLIPGGIALAFFSGLGAWLGAWLGASLAPRKGTPAHFRAGALGWITGVIVGVWWMVSVEAANGLLG